MSMLNDFKKIFFGAESVVKSAAGKAQKEAEEIGGSINEKAEEALRRAQEATEEIGKDILDKSKPLVEKAASTAEQVGEQILSRGEQLYRTINQEIDKRVNTEPKATPETHFRTEAESPVQTPEDLASSVLDDVFADSATNKAKEDMARAAFEQVQQQDIVDTVREAQGMNEDIESKVKPEPRRSFSDKVGYDNAKGSLLDGQDDFFKRAEQYATGNYSGVEDESLTPPSTTGATQISEDVTLHDKPEDFKKASREGMAYGFEDLDGDGDELIDDAILDLSTPEDDPQSEDDTDSDQPLLLG